MFAAPYPIFSSGRVVFAGIEPTTACSVCNITLGKRFPTFFLLTHPISEKEKFAFPLGFKKKLQFNFFDVKKMDLNFNSSKTFQTIDHLDDGRGVQGLSKVELINFNHLNKNSAAEKRLKRSHFKFWQIWDYFPTNLSKSNLKRSSRVNPMREN